MSKEELVRTYAEGRMSRRRFIRKLVGAGISVGAAATYAAVISAQRAVGQPIGPGQDLEPN